MLKNGTFTPSSTDAAMILTATNQRCCHELFDLHLSDVSCCFEVGKHPLGVLAASGSDESTSGAICITLREHAACCADRPRDTHAVVLPTPDCNHQFWKKQSVTNVTDIYMDEKSKRKNNHSMGTPPPVGFAASERAGARAREQLVLKTSAPWKSKRLCRYTIYALQVTAVSYRL